MTTYATNTTIDQTTDANYQAWVGEILTALYTQLGLTATADVCMLSTTNYNASVVVNAQTATNQLTVNSVTSGGNNICIGMAVVGTSIAAGTVITAVGTGTGGTGTYTLSTTPGTVTAESMTISLKAPNAANLQNVGATMFRFNDALQATLPIFIRLDFGSATSFINGPMMWITMGTGSNGTGTITATGYSAAPSGNAPPAKQACGYGQLQGSTSTNRPARYCYNTTQGFLGMAVKYDGVSNYCHFGIMIYRSVNASGAPTADSFHCITSSNNATGQSTCPTTAIYAANPSLFYLNAGSSNVGNIAPGYIIPSPPFNSTQTIMGGGGAGQVFPIYQLAPAGTTGPMNIGITNALCYGSLVEFAVGSTVTVTILGSTSLTYIGVGNPWGTLNYYMNVSFGTYWQILMLWQ